MNQELLLYSLTQSKDSLIVNLSSLEQNRAVTAEAGPRGALVVYTAGQGAMAAGEKPTTAAGNNIRVKGRPPTWRKPKQEVVDEKIEKMLEFYKEQDELLLRKEQMGTKHKSKKLADKYFPDDDEAGNDSSEVEIMNDDDDDDN